MCILPYFVRNCGSLLQCVILINILLYLIDVVFVGRNKICSGRNHRKSTMSSPNHAIPTRLSSRKSVMHNTIVGAYSNIVAYESYEIKTKDDYIPSKSSHLVFIVYKCRLSILLYFCRKQACLWLLVGCRIIVTYIKDPTNNTLLHPFGLLSLKLGTVPFSHLGLCCCSLLACVSKCSL